MLFLSLFLIGVAAVPNNGKWWAHLVDVSIAFVAGVVLAYQLS